MDGNLYNPARVVNCLNEQLYSTFEGAELESLFDDCRHLKPACSDGLKEGIFKFYMMVSAALVSSLTNTPEGCFYYDFDDEVFIDFDDEPFTCF